MKLAYHCQTSEMCKHKKGNKGDECHLNTSQIAALNQAPKMIMDNYWRTLCTAAECFL